MNVDSVPTGGFDTVSIPSCVPDAPATRRRVDRGRVEYVKEPVGYPPVRVIAEISPEGHVEFFEREFGEVHWYPYRPSEQERDRALELLLQSEA